MKMKRLLAWLLVLTMCFTLMACDMRKDDDDSSVGEPTPGQTDPPESGAATPLLYRVTDQKGNVVWLFGSIHVGVEDYYPLPDYVMDAFEGADSLAVELDILAFEKDMNQQIAALRPLVYMDGTTIHNHIPEELYEKAVAVLKEYNAYAAAMDMYCPAFWGSMIESAMMQKLDGDVNLGIDRHLLNKAYKAKKEILEIESAAFQYQMMADFDDDVQLMILQSALASYEYKEEAAAELKMLMELWASGDESALTAHLSASDSTMTAEEKAVYEKYNQAMVVDRNLTMAEYAEAALASGKEVFICVGAAHVVGEGAMADQLSRRGYTVERITADGEKIIESSDSTGQTKSVFNTENIKRITFYGYYGGGKGSDVPSWYVEEITQWLGSFTIGEEAAEPIPPGTNTYHIEIEYADGTVVEEGLDVITVDGTAYCVNKDATPDCFWEIVSV